MMHTHYIKLHIKLLLNFGLTQIHFSSMRDKYSKKQPTLTILIYSGTPLIRSPPGNKNLTVLTV